MPSLLTRVVDHSARSRIIIVMMTIVGIIASIGLSVDRSPAPMAAQPAPGEKEYFFCFWNVENLFDDKDDARKEVDEEYDNPFAKDAKLRQEKLDHLANALIKMNGGIGPDILVCVEVESVRAADLLRATLNKKLEEAKADPKLQYTQVAMKNLDAGRHIAPCVISRVPVNHALTKLHGRQLRILETHITVDGNDLCILATHWTSQLRQSDGGNGNEGRAKYATLCYDTFADLAKKNPATDFLLCGDFNDVPGSRTLVYDLGATGDRKRVTPRADKPQLLDLMAEVDPRTGQERSKDPTRFGTLWYNGQPLVYDHICVSPGMLDNQGWSCNPDAVRTFTDGLVQPGGTQRRPWRFGDPGNAPTGGRGYSDHFPVTVPLTLHARPKP